MSDFNGRIAAIIRAFQQDEPGGLEVRLAIRRMLKAEHDEGWNAGYGEGVHDQWEANRCEREREGGTIGPPLDEDDDHPEGDYDLWHMAVYIPAIPCGSEEAVAELLAANGIETYRMWPVQDPEQMRAAMGELTESLKARKDSAGG